MYKRTSINQALFFFICIFPSAWAIDPLALLGDPTAAIFGVWAENHDPTNPAWIKNIAAVGDSYSAGIGAGAQLKDSSDSCARYTESFPSLFERLDAHPKRNFTYVSCSGAITPEIIDQTKKLPPNQDVITVSSGGNDADLVPLLNSCVYGWHPLGSSCEDQIKKSEAIIEGQEFIDNLNKLASTVVTKINNDPKAPGRAYWMGYARFFNPDTTQCDNVSFEFWTLIPNPPKLTRDRRQKLNDLTVAVNDKIKQAIAGQSKHITYVDMDTYVSQSGGRFCEQGVQEPDYNREATMFFNTQTIVAMPDDSHDELKRGLPDGHSFEHQVFCEMAKGVSDNATLQPAYDRPFTYAPAGGPNKSLAKNTKMSQLQKGIETLKKEVSSNMTDDDCKQLYARSAAVKYLPRYVTRVFHPRSNLHWAMAQQVSYWVEYDRAQVLNKKTAPLYEVFDKEGASCTAPKLTPPSPKVTPPHPNVPDSGFRKTCFDTPTNGPLPMMFTRNAAVSASKKWCSDLSTNAFLDAPPGQFRTENRTEGDSDGFVSYIKFSGKPIYGTQGCPAPGSPFTVDTNKCAQTIQTIVDGCQTDTTTNKRGGTITSPNKCWTLTVEPWKQRARAAPKKLVDMKVSNETRAHNPSSKSP